MKCDMPCKGTCLCFSKCVHVSICSLLKHRASPQSWKRLSSGTSLVPNRASGWEKRKPEKDGDVSQLPRLVFSLKTVITNSLFLHQKVFKASFGHENPSMSMGPPAVLIVRGCRTNTVGQFGLVVNQLAQ